MLRRRPTKYGLIDVIAVVGIGAAWVIGAATVPWLRSPWILGLAIGAWAAYRSYAQFALEEIASSGVPEAADRVG